MRCGVFASVLVLEIESFAGKYRHDADIIQTGKIDYVLSCIFTSLQRVDMFLKSYRDS
jgi:hypothetical protein